VGNITFFGWTVVSTITCRVSVGVIAPLLTATERLSCSKAFIRSSPMRWRQRVSVSATEARARLMETFSLIEVGIADRGNRHFAYCDRASHLEPK